MPESIDLLVSKDSVSTPENFFVNRDITQKQLLQLSDYAKNDKEVVTQTSDPKRFADRGSLEKWLGKGGGRIIYTLTDKNEDLCGVIWFGSEQMPLRNKTYDYNPEDYGITFAIRTYAKARGKGVSGGFLEGAIGDFMSRDWYRKSPQKGIWLETSDTNLPAKKLYEKTGWIHVSEPDEKQRILMIYKGNK